MAKEAKLVQSEGEREMMVQAAVRILLVEDSPSDADVLQEVLHQSGSGPFEITCVDRLADGLARLSAASFDVLLLDLTLPDSVGPETFRSARKAAPRLPIVVLTGIDDEVLGLLAVREGIQDYLSKGQFDGRQMVRAIRYAIERNRAEEKLRELNATLERRASEFEAANLALRDSRRAAVNLMQDAVAAREAVERAGSALRESEQRFRSVLDNSWDVVFRVNVPAGRYEYISPSVEKIMGFAVAELMAMDVKAGLALVHPEDQLELRSAHASLESCGAVEVEYRQRTKGGDYRWMSTRLSLIRDASGRPQYRDGSIRDITERKRAEDELRRSEEQYRSLFRTLLEGFCVIEVLFDADGRPVDYRFLEINPAFEAQTGLRNAQGRRMRELAPDHEARWFEIYGRVALTGEPVRFSNEARALNRWYDVRAYRVGGPDSRKVAILFNDITETKRAEEALRASEARQRLVLQASSTGTFEFDLRSGVGRWNDREFELLGLRPGDAPPHPDTFFRYVHPDDAGVLKTQWEEALRTGTLDVEFRVVRADGVVRWLAGRGQFAWEDKDPGKSPEVRSQALRFLGVNFDITDRKVASEALRESEERFHRMFERHQAVMLVVHPETGAIIDANAAAARFYGYSREQLCGRHIQDINQLPAAEVAAERQKALAESRNYFVFPHRLASGDVRWVEVYSTPVETGGRSLLFSVVHDITDRKRAEQALETTLQRFYSVLSSMYSGVLLVTDDGRVEFANQAFCDRFGLDDMPADLVELGSAEMLERIKKGYRHPDEAVVRIQEILARGQPVRGEEVAMAGGGTCLRDFVPLIVQGKSYGRLWIHIDITERQRMEAALRRSEERYRNLVEVSPDAIFVNRNNRIVLVNPAALRLFGGADPGQLLGKTPFELFHPDNHEGIRERLGRIESGARMILTENKFVTMDGRVLDVEIAASVFEDQEGRAIQVILRDITERKRQERQLRGLNRTLQALGHSSQVLARATDEDAFLHEVCRMVVDDCGHAMVWVGLAEEDEARSVRPVASAGFDAGYLETLKISWADTERGRGPTGTAIRTATPVQCSNMRTDPRFGPWREEALKRGYASSLALPLLVAGKAFGAITIYSREPDPFFEEEVKLLSGLADDLAYGISALRLRRERRQAEQALQVNEARLRALTENTPAFICEIDRRGIIQFASQGLGGNSREEMVGTDALSWIPEAQRSRIGGSITEVFSTCESLTTEYDTAEGRTHMAAFSPIIVQGTADSVALTAIDITDRKRAEKALEQARSDLERKVKERTAQLWEYNIQLVEEISIRREKEAELRDAEFRFRTVAEFTQDWEYWETPEHTLRYCSPSCERITGYTSQELIADPQLMERMVHPEDAGVLRDHRHDAFTVSRPGVIQFRIRRKDGGIRWIEHACQPVLAEDGAFLGIRAGNRDVTARRETELETQRLRYELAHVTRVTTLGQLAASLAHELNQPLGAILCNAEAAQSLLAADVGNVEEVRAALGDIIEDDQRAGQVIRRLRAMFRKEATERQPLDVNDLVRETLALLRSELVIKNVTAQLDLASGLPLVNGGRVELQQVVMNLVLNAADATAGRESGRRSLQIVTAVDGARLVRVSVVDSGPGLPAELIAERWEPFFTTKPGGMGMGLSIARSIIEIHGGRLWAVNNSGQGATFHFTLPVLPEGNSA